MWWMAETASPNLLTTVQNRRSAWCVTFIYSKTAKQQESSGRTIFKEGDEDGHAWQVSMPLEQFMNSKSGTRKMATLCRITIASSFAGTSTLRSLKDLSVGLEMDSRVVRAEKCVSIDGRKKHASPAKINANLRLQCPFMRDHFDLEILPRELSR
jgi:hypothetical protein